MSAITYSFYRANQATQRANHATRDEIRWREPESNGKGPERLPAQHDLFDDIPIDDVYYVDDGCAACMLGRVMLLTLAIFVAGVAWAIWG